MSDLPSALQSKDTQWTASDLVQLRAYTEYYTNSTPCGPLEYAVYEQFRGWCQWPDKLEIIRSVIAARLALPGYSRLKALILAQALPPSALSTLIDPLTALIAVLDPSKGSYPHIMLHAVATALKGAGEAYKAAQAYAAQEEKWRLWTSQFGQSEVAWLPPPKPEWPEWGMYGMVWVPVDEWWVAK